jgi:hypothetical protein
VNGAEALENLGALALQRADHARAHELLVESLVLYRELGEKWNIAMTLARLATLAVRQGEPERAALLCGAAEALREAIGSNLATVVQSALEEDLPALRGALGDGVQAAWARGRDLALDEAIALALGPRGMRAVSPPWPDPDHH